MHFSLRLYYISMAEVRQKLKFCLNFENPHLNNSCRSGGGGSDPSDLKIFLVILLTKTMLRLKHTIEIFFLHTGHTFFSAKELSNFAYFELNGHVYQSDCLPLRPQNPVNKIVNIIKMLFIYDNVQNFVEIK